MAWPADGDDPRSHQRGPGRPPLGESENRLSQLRRDLGYALRAKESRRESQAFLPSLWKQLCSWETRAALLLAVVRNSLGPRETSRAAEAIDQAGPAAAL